MRYQFPQINHINDVLPIIKDSPEFIVAERDHFTVINYMVVHPDTFPEVQDVTAAIRRELRGIIFGKDGNVIARRLHKFFNVNERDETQQHLIDLSQPHVILEKLDGSMVTPIPVGDHIRWGTKMGITDVSMGAEAFVAKHSNYERLAQFLLRGGETPIFEWCSRKQRIVIDYPEDRLVLIAVRNNVTGEYYSYDDMVGLALLYEVDVVKAYNGNANSMENLINETRDLKGIEGWVIRFDDGHMLKIKAEEYLRFHKTKDNLSQEKNVIDLLITENVDDAKSFMMPEDRHRVEQFEEQFWKGFDYTVEQFRIYYLSLVEVGIDRKTWALEHMKEMNQRNRYASAIVFALFDGKDCRKVVLDIIAKNISTQTKVDECRVLWGNARWSYSFGDE